MCGVNGPRTRSDGRVNEARPWPTRVTRIGLAAGVSVAVSLAFVWYVRHAEPVERPAQEVVLGVEESVPLTTVDGVGHAGSAASVDISTDAGWAQVVDSCVALAEPMTSRLSPVGGFTAECEAALDRRFLDTVPSSVPVLARDDSLTWRHVFSAPSRSREKSLQVLTAQCREATRECDVHALAAFAVLKYQCGGRRYSMLQRIGPGIYEVIARAALDDLADNAEYWRRREDIETAYYRTAWLAAKCDAIPDGVLTSFVDAGRTSAFPRADPRIPPRIVDVAPVGHHPRPGQQGWWWAEQAWEAYQLMRYASAVDQLHADRYVSFRYEYGRPDPNSWQGADPLLAEIVQLKRWRDPVDRGKYRNNRLRHAYLASIWADAQDVVLDRKWLFAQIGDPVTEKEWQRARRDAGQLLRAQGRRLLLVEALTNTSR